MIPTLRVERDDAANLSMQLATHLRELILAGDLPPGTRLPASRVLASEQGVSRTTAVAAYEQLTSEGLLVSRVGAGTYISDEVRTPPAHRTPFEADGHLPRLAHFSREISEQFFPRLTHPCSPRPFVTGMPAFDAFPMAQWSRLSAKYWRGARADIMSYPDATGLPELRMAICRHLRANRGLVCEPEEVFVFAGAQDAFLQIAQMLLDPGDRVWMENPGAIGARNAFLSRGAELVPVPVDAEGLDVAAGRRACPNMRMAFVTPAHQHPMGYTMSRDRRFELLAAAEESGAWIVEDDYVGEFHYGRSPLPPLKALDGAGRVVYVGTFSKALFPAIRLGYAVVPSGLVDIFERTLGAAAHGVSHAMQSIVADFIAEGHFSAHLRRMRDLYRTRRDALLAAGARHLDGRLMLLPTETGFHTVGLLPEGADEARVVEAVSAAGLATAPLSRFALSPLAVKGLTLGFSAVAPHEMEKGVERLAAALRALG
ncbi:PLP-dependent aminotransferase family protein [Acuticoccus sp. M5D2P5]|uniref:MocR-like pyridoxine biosynthesis transcription factor PdxR n=1 Tax=Acuticoccus kalidii TaxID=2910977 RepID=UPI001F43A886|nr:PLP-dependent aminotransferase family protein [Acuticoccus kalidii]MCF3934837.1 PLP-dependent aminotransferase family protein [Acuticoccus kalidii]